MQTDRYSRQTCLPEIGHDGQKKLSESSILCVGAGGLGSPALLYLAAAGIGKIGIIDFDRIDESNLQRQIIFSSNNVGQSKAKIAAERVLSLNPHITVEYYDATLTPAMAQSLFPAYDIIIDGTDNFDAKFLINDAAVKFGKPWIYGSIQGFDGQASVFNDKDGPCYRCLYPEKPKANIMNCAESGVIGAVAGLIGVTQALQAIQIITAHKSFSSLSGLLWMLDTRSMQVRTLSIRKNMQCKICSINRDEIILNYTPPSCGSISEVTISDLNTLSDVCLIDVREENEWENGHIEGALLCPLSKIMIGETPDITKNSTIVLYCQKGVRSLQAARKVKEKISQPIFSLSGGYDAWLKYKTDETQNH
ncbi:HesA/MoeB/ThiF family protein [Micavibrio aeruginosavorus]|uniref:Molybdopterin-synthase adenylyltransferase n=1 Tax=Micavibrio aeruginosavorus EPB TaxID=349215 RepID=M4VEL2_9BACT|nr:HesA/MoeB/ThiF family protein [Micavibrio aeruginosavorus]AGH97668.1 Sulfur carrier protein adenylyltransferase ThiF [Micavibrio aeruginosavorus EPB]